MAQELARQHHIDEEKAAQAGLLHDLAKYFKSSLLLEMAQEAGIEIDPVLRATPHLLHADVSAIVARKEFGVEDEAVLEAIALHTLGRPEMSLLSCIVFVADTLEPGRGDTPELQYLRQVSFTNLHQAVWLTCDYSLKYLIETRRSIHPRTVATRNWALSLVSKKFQPETAIAP